MLKKILENTKIDTRYIIFIEEFNKYLPSYMSYSRLRKINIPGSPAYIPVLEDEHGIDTYGIIKHWFTSRELIFTTMHGEWKTYLEEARTFETFITRVFLDWIMHEDKVTGDMEELAKILNYNRLEEVDKFSDEYGDNPNEITKLKYYNRLSVSLPNITPIEYIDRIDRYTGNFPTSSKGFVNIDGIDTATTFEIQDAAKPIVERLENLPEWLKEGANQKYLFDKYIDSNELDKAWLTLNSTGWKLVDVANALELLTTKTDEKGFDLMVENWMHNWKNSFFYKDILEY